MAFHHSGVKRKAGNAWLHLYRVDPALRGFEVVVASSNNKGDDAARTNNKAQASLARIEQRFASHDFQKPEFFAQGGRSIDRYQETGHLRSVVSACLSADRRGREPCAERV